MSNKKSLLIIVVILIVLLIVGIWAYLYLQDRQPNMVINRSQSLEDLVTYKSESGYSFYYPKDWVSQSNKQYDPDMEYVLFPSPDTLLVTGAYELKNIYNVEPGNVQKGSVIDQYIRFNIGKIVSPVSIDSLLGKSKTPNKNDYKEEILVVNNIKVLKVSYSYRKDTKHFIDDDYRVVKTMFLPSIKGSDDISPMCLIGTLEYVSTSKNFDADLSQKVMESLTLSVPK